MKKLAITMTYGDPYSTTPPAPVQPFKPPVQEAAQVQKPQAAPKFNAGPALNSAFTPEGIPKFDAGGGAPAQNAAPQFKAPRAPAQPSAAQFDPMTLRSGLERVESGGGKNMKNPTSSAAGSLQYIRGTALGYANRNPQEFQAATGMSPQQLGALNRAGYQNALATNPKITDYLWNKGSVPEMQDLISKYKIPADQQQRFAAMVHYQGPKAAINMFRTGRANVVGEGTINIPANRYFSRAGV